MLGAITPGLFSEWLAFEEIEGDPVQRLIEVVKLAAVAVCSALGMRIEPEMLDPQETNEQECSPEQGAAIARAKMGAGRP
jgi:hypothetical protein